MRFALLCHSLVSDWNHGNAHFLRGIARELLRREQQVTVYEPQDAWSRRELQARQGASALQGFSEAFPELRSRLYDPASLAAEELLAQNDVVLLHEWSDPLLVDRLARAREARGRWRSRARGALVLWHDTHHRAVSEPDAIERLAPLRFDGVLAFGASLARIYLRRGWARRAWVWHEAADTTLFRPSRAEAEGDVVWIGNWGDGERARELEEFFVEPVERLGLRALVHGVRYPDAVLARLDRAGIHYGGWLANHRVPEVFARFRATVHVPRRPYRKELAGIPTIRIFEALACGLPLVAAGWRDTEGLFREGRDLLSVEDGAGMTRVLGRILEREELARELSASGVETIRARHTCALRVDQLLGIVRGLARERAGRALAGRSE